MFIIKFSLFFFPEVLWLSKWLCISIRLPSGKVSTPRQSGSTHYQKSMQKAFDSLPDEMIILQFTKSTTTTTLRLPGIFFPFQVLITSCRADTRNRIFYNPSKKEIRNRTFLSFKTFSLSLSLSLSLSVVDTLKETRKAWAEAGNRNNLLSAQGREKENINFQDKNKIKKKIRVVKGGGNRKKNK